MSVQERSAAFCRRFGLRVPILLAPMAGVPAAALSIAVANAGAMGALGALLMTAEEIASWTDRVRAASNGGFQINLWVPDPPPARDAENEALVRAFLGQWGPAVGSEAGDARPLDFESQCEAVLAARPSAVSSIMGLYPPAFVARLKREGVAWLANVTTVAEAKAAQAAGADVIVAQGMEAGGHRGRFDASAAEREMVGLFALVPAIADAVKAPVVASGGIADGRGVAAALALGASAVQIGTGFLRTPEAAIHPAWAAALAEAAPEETLVTRAFSGRPGRSLATAYARAAVAPDAPAPAPYPVQRGLTAAMRAEAAKAGDVGRMQAWAGQSAGLAQAAPAAEIVDRIWSETAPLLGLTGSR
jgi:nitronate monooxygenase